MDSPQTNGHDPSVSHAASALALLALVGLGLLDLTGLILVRRRRRLAGNASEQLIIDRLRLQVK
jgi:hypothetical protein